MNEWVAARVDTTLLSTYVHKRTSTGINFNILVVTDLDADDGHLTNSAKQIS
jgi:hypothetical protein